MGGGGEPFVGREAELGRLVPALEHARRGHGGVFLVIGEAGIGKTRLVSELATVAEASGMRVGFGRAWERSGSPAFYIWTTVLPSLAEDLVEHLSIVAEDTSFAALARVARHVAAFATDGPALVVLEDVQWADTASLLELHFLARNPPSQLVIVATARIPDMVPPRTEGLLHSLRKDAAIVALEGLSAPELDALARALGTTAPPPALHRITNGNPWFAREILLDGFALASLHRDQIAIPHELSGYLARRFALLAQRTRDVLGAAALAGQTTLETERVSRAVGSSPDEVAACVVEAAQHGLVVQPQVAAFRFTHDLVRIAAAEQLLPSRAAELHHAWARELDDHDPTASVFHSLAAEPGAHHEGVRDRALRAARLALGRRSHEEAATLYELAADLDLRGNRLADASRTLCSAAEALVLAGAPAQATAAAERALGIARAVELPEPFARAVLARGLVRTMGVADPGLIALLDEALVAADKVGDAALRCAVGARLAAALQPFEDPTRALALARDAIGRARGAADDLLLARTIHAARPAFRILDDLDERQSLDGELLYLATKLGDALLAANARARLCLISIERGDAAALDENLASYERLAGELHLPHHDLAVQCANALRAIIRGQPEPSATWLGRIEQDRPRWTASSHVTLPLDPVVALRGARCLLVPDPGAFTAMATTPTPPRFHAMLRLFAAVKQGRLDEAAAAYPELAGSVETPRSANFTYYTILATAAVALRDRERALRLYQLLEPFRGRHVVWTPAWFYDGAIDRLRAHLAWLIGDTSAALRHFTDAIAGEQAFLAEPFAQRTRAEWSALAEGPVTELDVRTSRATETWKLTRRQTEVVRLVAQGGSNKAVAQTLGCAERTVEVHITAILRKAGLLSRGALISRFWSGP